MNVHRVIPIFSAFEIYLLNIHFECTQIVSSCTAQFQRVNRSFADGLGYSALIGHTGYERFVIEAFSGGYEKNQEHT
ncbi:hypothetical protein BDC45DRAFT_293073 [Circinella umbellata]|nr:hypothetical protein BDC45DRAFT_293073 [Circinella umbellata]